MCKRETTLQLILGYQQHPDIKSNMKHSRKEKYSRIALDANIDAKILTKTLANLIQQYLKIIKQYNKVRFMSKIQN